MTQLYDTIGSNYGGVRRPDPYWHNHIGQHLGSKESVINIGAGTGSYEPRGKRIVAVEPSFTMIKQRPIGAASVVQAIAEALPFRDESFSIAMSVLSSHHWEARSDAFEEIGRVLTRKAVFVTWDPAHEGYWLTQDYFPEIVAIDREIFPSISEFEHAFGQIEVYVLPVRHNCEDGFLGAYWRRPYAYLDSGVRGGISTFSKLRDAASGLDQLSRDLESGEWLRRYGYLLENEVLDLGYRIIVADVTC